MSENTFVPVVIKRPNAAPFIAQVENNLKTLRAIVEGHTRQTVIGNDGHCRFVAISRLGDDGELNMVIDGVAMLGPIVVSKIDPTGQKIGLTEDECAKWIERLDKLCIPQQPESSSIAADETSEHATRTINDRHSIQLVPSCLTDEEGQSLTPEQVIERMAKSVGMEFKHVPLTDQNVYGSALVVLESQGVNYSVIDEASMLLDMPDQGETKCERERFVRIIEITKIDNDDAKEIFPHLGSDED